MFTPCAKRLQLVKQQGGFGNEIGVTGDILHQLRQKWFFVSSFGFAKGAKQIFDMKNANNIVRLARENWMARMR